MICLFRYIIFFVINFSLRYYSELRQLTLIVKNNCLHWTTPLNLALLVEHLCDHWRFQWPGVTLIQKPYFMTNRLSWCFLLCLLLNVGWRVASLSLSWAHVLLIGNFMKLMSFCGKSKVVLLCNFCWRLFLVHIILKLCGILCRANCCGLVSGGALFSALASLSKCSGFKSIGGRSELWAQRRNRT